MPRISIDACTVGAPIPFFERQIRTVSLNLHKLPGRRIEVLLDLVCLSLQWSLV